MKSNLTYSKAFLNLEKIVTQIEEGNIPLEMLAEKVSQANELIKFCETRLRTIEKDVIEAGRDSISRKKKTNKKS